jgi:dienelactone hydrolase
MEVAMEAQDVFDARRRTAAAIALAICLAVLLGAVVIAWLVQRDFGHVEVSNVTYPNVNGIPIRAKLLRHVEATAAKPAPGIVYVHGYQNNRETSDAYAIELARRGFVVLSIDAIGRGNSGVPGDPEAADFDETYGAATSLAYLKSLPYVRGDMVGMMGHSLGAEMAYTVALQDPTVKALAFSGFAYRDDATAGSPKNMLMIIGQYDEYRERMTGVDDIEAEWMGSPPTAAAIPVANPQLGVTYGDFQQGTARQVFVPRAIHLQESHSRAAIARAVDWMHLALQPQRLPWIDTQRQTWPVKEWATGIALVAGTAALLPLAYLLLGTRLFRPLQGPAGSRYAATGRAYLKWAAVNGLLMLLYLPLIFALFGLHVYVVPIDGVFPMMMVNGIVWWFVVINVIGFLLFRRWFKRRAQPEGVTLAELGISDRTDRFGLDWGRLGRAALLAGLLFAFAYLLQAGLERLFIVDYRVIFPFASDLTPYRWLMFAIYFPFLLLGFLLLGMFLHGQMRRPWRKGVVGTWAAWSAANVLVLVVPLLVLLAVQYLPLLAAGVIPFVGPGGVLATFVMNLFHVIGVLVLVIPVSTWLYQLTGKIYAGAILSAALVAWMFTSSQVIAPIPI